MAPASESNPFGFGSGLLDDVDVEITDAEFGYDDDFTNDDGDPIFVLMLDVHPESDDDEDQRILLTCGDAFTTRDNGATASRHDESDKTFNKSSKVAILVNSAMENGGRDDLMARYENEKLGPLDAAFYIGWRFRLVREEVEYKKLGRTGNNVKVGENGWHGLAGSKSSGSTEAKAKGKPAAKAKAKSSGDGESGLTDDLLKKLDGIADEAADFEEFKKAAIDALTDEQANDQTILDAIGDGESDDGIWGRAVERA